MFYSQPFTTIFVICNLEVLPVLLLRVPHSGSMSATENDLLVRHIGERGRQFARQWTTRSARLKYWKLAIERYAELFKDFHTVKGQNLTMVFG